ncbi:hypothetical protein [Christiangramia forsetii]|uniref:Uncharacterized protein n=2 Tax=Christiangramia forsetii TaxID=411153 RepID=A0M4P7_CHRFK|nr:hypothetical protein [Christiangramia forsetii]GGG22945.1 hypothetical protein GCM10011532_02550 [Christiangramia forsetii]CAL67592.1 hypothetical protein GFO_2636 [Christiangramia forsetii KT0803]
MKTPNYEEQQGKHPIPHAKGIAKDEKEKDMKEKSEKKSDEEE